MTGSCHLGFNRGDGAVCGMCVIFDLVFDDAFGGSDGLDRLACCLWGPPAAIDEVGDDGFQLLKFDDQWEE